MADPNSTFHFIAKAFHESQLHCRRRGVLLVDDHDLVRLGLRALILAQTDPNIPQTQVFEAKTLAAATAVYESNRESIDLVFLDLGLPDCNGLRGLEYFKSLYPQSVVVVVSGESDPATMQHAIAIGATAYLRKTADLSEVISFIRSLSLREIGSEILNADAAAALSSSKDGLTLRQNQILGLLLEGKSNKEIGLLTFLSEGTVKNHVSTILLHFGVRSRSQLLSQFRHRLD